MTGKQEKFYWSLWAMVRGVEPKRDRHELHAELGLPESHKFFSQADFDTWKGRCMAIARPAAVAPQLAMVKMDRTRRLWLAARLCKVLGKDEGYGLGVLRKMNREGALQRAELGLEDLKEEELDKILTALRQQCRRQWRRKGDLIGGLREYCRRQEIDEEAARTAAAKAMHCETAPDLEELHYDELLIVLAGIMDLVKVEDPF